MRQIDFVVLHCTDSDSPLYDLEAIREDHIENRGWDDVGYHWIIDLEGAQHPGRPETIRGAHVKGHNSNSIGVAYMGTFPNIKQEESILNICIYLMAKYKIEPQDFLGHRELDKNKTCPNFDVNLLRSRLVRYS